MLLIALNMVGQNIDIMFDPESAAKAVKEKRIKSPVSIFFSMLSSKNVHCSQVL